MSEKGKLLIVDDDNYILLSLRMFLENHFEYIETLNTPSKIPNILKHTTFDTVLLDMNFRKGDTRGDEGIKWLSYLQEHSPTTSVIMITAYGEINKAVRAVKAGAIDFVVKPWENEKLLPTVLNATKLAQSQKEISHLRNKERLIEQSSEIEIIGESKAILKLKEEMNKVADTDANILIYGENGTGKEVVAQNIHRRSKQSNKALISVDLGAITDTLFESELFGHKKGAFTDAKEDRIGRVEAASGSSLFLDEISNLPLNLQPKLLKVLQERQVTPLGSNQALNVNFRLICASNEPLHQLVEEGKFRQDLLYRINTVEINIPPLRERSEDIPLLAKHFISSYKRKYRKPNLQLPDYVSKKLQKFDWPGNVRELKHAIERAVIMSDGKQLKSSDFNFLSVYGSKKEIESDDFNLDKLEKKAIENCIKKHAGNLTKAANELGLTRGALYRRLEKHDL